ncbi:MAG: hypothetical protein WBV82_26000 [Myxococcaceae bacterium]
MWKFIWLGAAGIVISLVSLVIRYTAFLDLEGYEFELILRAPAGDYGKTGAALHTGPGPCLRYGHAYDGSERDAEAIAREFLAAGIDGKRFGDLAGYFRDWTEELERLHHVDDAIGEHITLLSRASLGAGVIVRLNHSRFRESAERAELSHRNRAVEAWSMLSPEQQDTVRHVFDRNPRGFSQWLSVMHAYSGVETEKKLGQLAAHVEDLIRSGQTVPRTVDGLAGLPPEAHKDGWGEDFEIEQTDVGYRIRSNGGDFTRGGEGWNKDSFREVAAAGARGDAGQQDPVDPVEAIARSYEAQRQSRSPETRYEVVETFSRYSPCSAFVVERLNQDGRCLEGVRKLSCESETGTITGERVLGHDCCAGQPCPDRSPGGLMYRFYEALAHRDDERLRALVDPEGRVIAELGVEGHRSVTKSHSRRQFGTNVLGVLTLNLSYEEWECSSTRSRSRA